MFEGIKAAIVADRYAYFEDFLNNFYNVDKLAPARISDWAWQNSFNVAAGASPYATYACVDTWLTDFRDDLPKIDVPVLVVHGTEDRILPYQATASRLPALIKDVRLVTVDRSMPAAYPNGRALTDDVYSMRHAWLTYGRVGSDGLKPHDDLLPRFPYLGSPNP